MEWFMNNYNNYGCNLEFVTDLSDFHTDNHSLVGDNRVDGQEHVFLTDDKGESFVRLVLDNNFINATENESK